MFFKLSWPVLVLALLPLLVSYYVYPVTHLPPGFGVFPPQLEVAAPIFLAWYFAVVALVVIGILSVYAFPKMFGFKGAPAMPREPSSVAYPWWFYLGGLITVVSWWLMWARPASLLAIVPYAFSPLWWGFIIFLDGIVYKRNNGASFMSTKPGKMLICALVSMIGWVFFEYFDYFVLESWYYPQVDVLPHLLTTLVYLIAYTTVWPAVFEWYNLFNTFPKFVARYQNGPKITFNGKWVLALGFVLMVVTVINPHGFFWGVWIAPMLVFAGIVLINGIKNPLDDLVVGNWAPILLIMLACFLNGFVWEAWNYGSTHPLDPVTNVNYWKYNVPYVNVIHIFSEMPLLGYFGYMPFGILVWQFYVWAGKLCGFDADINVSAKP